MNSDVSGHQHLCVVMPAYNEEGCIEAVVRGWLEHLKKLPNIVLKFIVVNDGSRDRTGQILDSIAASEPILSIVHQVNGGHGKALMTGYRTALTMNSTWVFHVDSDDQFQPEDFSKLWALRDRAPFLMGIRAERHDALHRLVITKILLLFNFVIFGAYLRDANIPYRLIRTNYLRALLNLIPESVFAPNIFLAVLAKKDGRLLQSVPVTHRDRTTGKVSIVRLRLIKACLRCVAELIQFRLSLPQKLRELRSRTNIDE